MSTRCALCDSFCLPPKDDQGEQATWSHHWTHLETSTALAAEMRIHRSVPVHDYCLGIVLALSGLDSPESTSQRQDSLLLHWSIPMWAGRVGGLRPPIAPPDPLVNVPPVEIHGSPVDVGCPAEPKSETARDRVVQTSPLVLLPDHVLCEIAMLLVSSGQENDTGDDNDGVAVGGGGGDTDTTSLQALGETCRALRSLPLPLSFYRALATSHAEQYTNGLARRWLVPSNCHRRRERAYTLSALASAFTQPLLDALSLPYKEGKDESEYEEEEHEYARVDATRVWRWWALSEDWRARRAVWRRVVDSCVQARETEFWWVTCGF